MNNIHCTIIHFDYGGHYSRNGDDIRWVSLEDKIYTLVMKTSIEDVTYSELVDKICRKIVIDKATTKLKISYIPFVVAPNRPSYILDDEEVFAYLVQVNKDQCRSVLHVELFKEVEQNQECQQLSREDRGSEIGVSSHELLSSGRGASRVNDGITPITWEPSEHYEQMNNDENVLCEEFANVDNSGMHKDTKVTLDVEGDQYQNVAWEDGLNLTLGQEFGSKQAVQDLVEKASLLNRFEFATIKSDPKLYLIKCCEAKIGCKWSLRVAKAKNSDCFSVRTYNKMHTCSQATTSTGRNRRKGTPRLVASILHEEYPNQFNTPSPKDLIGLVQKRFGVKVSYATALRGKKQAANDVQGSNSLMDHTSQ